MANLMSIEESAKLEEAKRNERIAIERGRQLEDLLHRCIGDVADARASVHRLSKQGIEVENKLSRAQFNERRLVERVKAALDWIHEDHFKRVPSHKKAPGPAARKGCKACELIIQIQHDAAEFGKELAR
jgi:hypothetical protein